MEKMRSENCGPGCDCGKPSGNKKAKTVICLTVLLAICGIFVYKTTGAKQSTPTITETAFAASQANQGVAGTLTAPETIIVPADTTSPSGTVVPAGQDAAVSSGADSQPAVNTPTPKKHIGDFLDSLGSLNKLAVNQDAVFVFIPANDNEIVKKETLDAIASAEQKIKSSGVKIGLYTLQFSMSKEYADIAAQLTLPGILVMSKGKGMGVVSGGITETKLLQAYVTSSRAGGCGPSGCGPSSTGCGPAAPVGPRR